MAALGHTVDPDGGGDYVSQNACEIANTQNLTDGGGDTYTCTCTSSGGTADTTAVDWDGWTTSATYYVTVIAAGGHEALKTGWDVSRYRFEVVDANPAFAFEVQYMYLLNLQIKSNADSSTSLAINIGGIAGGGGVQDIGNCRVAGVGGSTNRGIKTNDAQATANIYNCIVDTFTTDGIVNGAGVTNIYNSLVYGCGGDGIENDSGTQNAYNCVSFKNGDDFDLTTVISYCASDDNTDTDGSNVAESGGGVEWPDDFVDAGAGDFTVKGTSNLMDGGVNDPGSGLFSVDIEGDIYVVDSWPVGVDQYVAGGQQYELTGTIPGAASVTDGLLHLIARVSGDTTGVASVTNGALRLIARVSGDTDGTSTAGGALKLIARIAAAVSALSVVGGDLTIGAVLYELAGTISSLSTTGAAAKLVARLAGDIVAQSDSSGAIKGIYGLTGDTDGQSGIGANLDVPSDFVKKPTFEVFYERSKRRG